MKEVLADIDRWRSRAASGWRWPGWSASRAPGPRCPGATMVVSEAGEVAGSVSGGCVEGAVVTEALEVLGRRASHGAVHLRLLRRRGLRRRTDLRWHHPGPRRAARLVSGPLYERARPPRCGPSEPVVLATWPRSTSTAADELLGRQAAGASRRADPVARARLGDADLDRVVARDARRGAGRRPHRHPPLRPPRRGRGARTSGVHRVVRPAAPHDHLRRRGLHRGARPGGQDPRLPGDGLRRPAGVRHPGPVPHGRRGRRRLARPVPGRGRRPTSGRATWCAC